jgi:hypothetical protein
MGRGAIVDNSLKEKYVHKKSQNILFSPIRPAPRRRRSGDLLFFGSCTDELGSDLPLFDRCAATLKSSEMERESLGLHQRHGDLHLSGGYGP